MYVNFTTDRCTKRCVSSRLWRIWSLSFPLFLFASLQVSVAASRPDAKGAPGIAMAKVALQQQVSGQVTDSTSQPLRSEEHTSELQSLMCISYAVFCFKKKKKKNIKQIVSNNEQKKINTQLYNKQS